MKTKVMNLILAAATLMAAAACTNDDNVTVDNNPVAARITAAMEKTATATPTDTRAVGASWNKDEIGVVVVQSPGSDMAERYRNAHYMTTSTGTTAEFTPADAANTIYFAGSNEAVEFRAYAPYQPSATPGELPGTNGVIPVDVTTQTDADEQEAIDFLVATGATASKASPTVAFTRVDAANDHSFRHVMSRLELIIETPAAYGFAPTQVADISNVSLGLLAQSGTFDVKTGIAAAATTGAIPAWDITGNVNATSAPGTQRTYTLILLPQQVKNAAGTPAAVPISITLDGQVYGNDTNITGSLGDNGETGFFLPGKSYEYTIRLKKNSLEVTGATVTDWTDAGGSTGDATQQP